MSAFIKLCLFACRPGTIVLLFFFLAGCAATSERQPPPSAQPPAAPAQNVSTPKQLAVENRKSGLQQGIIPPMVTTVPTCGECQSTDQEGQRGGCFNLRPGRAVPSTKIVKGKNGKKRTVAGTRTSRCQPQSLIYARCRTGIDTCRLGDTSPVQWFACARKNGATTSRPQAGSVIILAANKGHCMPTGHPAYVEEVCANKDGTWTLRLSHTNYDRRCHLDRDAKVIFCLKKMQARFITGPWSAWGNDLKVLGFIVG